MNRILLVGLTLLVTSLCFIPAASAHTRFDPLILDLKGDGVDLSNAVLTSTLVDSTADPVMLRWTKANTDDGFLVLDATSLRVRDNITIVDGANAPIDGNTMFRDGLRVRRPDGSETVINDGWQMLQAFDTDSDGQVGTNDTVWGLLKLFVDKNADGTMSSDELRGLDDAGLASLFQTLDPVYFDPFGNEVSPGGFDLVAGGSGFMANISLRVVPEPSSLALAGAALISLGWLTMARRRKRRVEL